MDFTKPEEVSDPRRFLGMINNYRSSVPGSAQIQAPLTDNLKNARKNDKRKIDWTPAVEEAFEKCERGVVDATQTAYLHPDARLLLKTDASDTVIGAASEQLQGDVWQPLAFFSRKLTNKIQHVRPRAFCHLHCNQVFPSHPGEKALRDPD